MASPLPYPAPPGMVMPYPFLGPPRMITLDDVWWTLLEELNGELAHDAHVIATYRQFFPEISDPSRVWQ